MTRTILIASFILIFQVACGSVTPTEEVDLQATEVSRQVASEVSWRLTAFPTAVPTHAPTDVPITSTPEPSQTPTPKPTPTMVATATATAYPNDPKQTLGAPTWQDSFDSGANWYLYEDDHTKVELEDGKLVLNAKYADGWSGWALSWPYLQNFNLETTMIPGDCAGLDRYGLVFRAENPDQAYLFGVSCDGNYSLRKWDVEHFTMIQIWTPSQMIHTGLGETNIIGVMAQEDQFAMYVNGQFLGVVADAGYEAGAFGLFVGAVNTPGFQVTAQEIAYWELPGSE